MVPYLFVCPGVAPPAWRCPASHRLWEAGAPPSFGLEVDSQRIHRRDRREKPAVYLEVGVGEYWRVDPTSGDLETPVLQGDRRTGDAWSR